MAKCRITTPDINVEVTATSKRRALFIDWVRTDRELTPAEHDIIDAMLNDIADAMEGKGTLSNARD